MSNRKQREQNRLNAKMLASNAHICSECGDRGFHWIQIPTFAFERLLGVSGSADGFWTCPKLYGEDGRRLEPTSQSAGELLRETLKELERVTLTYPHIQGPLIKRIRAHLSQASEQADGVMVPREPTEAMLDAAADRSHAGHPPLLRIGYEYANMRELWRAMISAAPAASVSADDYRLAVRILYRTLERLSLAIEGCAKIGFEESSPTKNPQHFEVWNCLNDAQKAAKEKISDYHAAMKDNSK